MKKSSSRYLRWSAANWAAARVGPLRRAIPFYQEAARPPDEARIATLAHSEGWNPAPGEADLGARRQQAPIPAELKRDTVLYRLRDATVLGNTGVIVDEGTERLLAFPSVSLEVTYHHFRPVYLRPREKRSGAYFFMLGSYRGHEHLYHFLFDRLPHLWFLGERFDTGTGPITVLTNENLPEFQADAYRFAAARNPRLRFEAVPGNERWRLDTLYQIDREQAVEFTYADPDALAYVGDLFLEGYGAGRRPRGTRRLYISRADTKKRHIVNEDALLPILKAHDFEIVEAAHLTFREQVATFAEASHIVGTHGAGLSHLVFSPPDAGLMEIFPANKIIVSYYLLARSLGRRYRSLTGGPGEHREHYFVDPAAFETALTDFLYGPPGPA